MTNLEHEPCTIIQMCIRDSLFTAPSGKNTWDTTFNDYFGAKYDSNAVLLQIFHTTDGKVVAINFGKDGYMVTIVPGKETTCVYNGKSLKSIEG